MGQEGGKMSGSVGLLVVLSSRLGPRAWWVVLDAERVGREGEGKRTCQSN